MKAETFGDDVTMEAVTEKKTGLRKRVFKKIN